MSFGKKINELRKKHKLTQKELAKRVGCLDTQRSHYENDKMTPSIDVIIKLSEVFEVSIDYLVKDELTELAKEKIVDMELLNQFEKISRLEDKTKNLIKEIIDGIVLKNQLKTMVT